MLLSLLAFAHAAPVDLSVDESIRPPGHVRAAQIAPERLRDVGGPRPARVWWDAGSGPAIVEAEIGGRWVVLADDALPGFETRPLSPGASVRVRWPGGAPSGPTIVQMGAGPAAIAALAGPGLPGAAAADIAPVEGGAWVAMLGGGLVRLNAGDLEVEAWGRDDGLPGDQVNAVAASGDRIWVGTDRGLALIEGGEVSRVWDDELPDPWVQSLLPIADPETAAVWTGTYRGLSRVRGGAVEEILAPWSVFALGLGNDGRSWVGYEGLRGLPDGEPIEGVDPELNIWDFDLLQPRTYLATDTEGLLRLEEGVLTTWWTPPGGAVYALERAGGRLYAAADADGLAEISDVEGLMRTWDEARGLPSDIVYEVVEGPPGKLWVGTDGGVALAWPEQDVIVPWPRSPAAEGSGATALYVEADRAMIGTFEGVSSLGALPRRWRDAAAIPGPVAAILPQGRAIWVIGTDDAWRVERGRVERYPLPSGARAAVEVAGSIWVGGPGGIHRFEPRLGRFLPGPDVGDVTQMLSWRGQLWLAAEGRVVSVDPAGRARTYLKASAPLCLAGAGAGIWVGTASGAELLDPIDGEVTRVGELRAPIRAIVDDGARAIAATEGGQLIWLPSGLPIEGLEGAAAVGAIRGVQLDAQGRLWVLGDQGGFVAGL